MRTLIGAAEKARLVARQKGSGATAVRRGVRVNSYTGVYRGARVFICVSVIN